MKRKVFRWCVRVAVLLGVFVSAALVFVVWVVGDFGESGTERWLGERLRTVVNERLNATVDFDTLDYQYPDTVVLTGLRLTVEDAPTAQAFELVRCDEAILSLAERPKKNQPVRVRHAKLEKPVINLMRHPDGGLIGFSGLIRAAEQPETKQEDKPGKTFGQQFAIEAVEVVGARLTHSVSADRLPLVLDGINANTTLHRTDADAMALDVTLNRPGSFEATAKGTLRTDTGVIHDAWLDAVLDLSGEGLRSLPTELQELASQHELTGTLEVKAKGDLELRQVEHSAMGVTVKLRDAGFAWAGLRYPVSELTVAASTADGVLTFQQAEGDVLGGWASLNGTLALEKPWLGQGAVSLDAVRLEAREIGEENAVPLLTGAVTGRVTWDGPLGDVRQATGGGNFRIEEGRLSRIPVVSTLMDTLSIVPGMGGPRDRAEVVFKIADGQLVLENSFLSVDAAGIKATGTVGMDGTLDLIARAGPLERIEKKLGKLGDLLSATLSFLPRYRVTGTLETPLVGVALPNAKPQGQ